MRTKRLLASEDAQATVETAIVAPMNVFLILGVLQLGMLQHAQVLTEYAAFQAARAGIVHHGNRVQMKKAAFLSLLPTITRVYKGAGTLTNVIAKVRIYDQLGVKGFMTAEAAKWENFAQDGAFRGDAIALIVGDNQFDFIRVDTLAPKGGGRFGTFGGNVLAGSASNEIDFDDVSSPGAIASNLLSIRLTYYYVMRVPFANWVIYNSWMAARVGQALMLGETVGQRTMEDHVNQYATDAGGMRVTGAASGELRKLRLLSLAGLYCLPISTTYTMRMQSNQFRKFMP